MENFSLDEEQNLRDQLREKANTELSLRDLPLSFAKIVHHSLSHISPETRKQAIDLIRKWSQYAYQHQLSPQNPFLIRYHLNRFATQEFGRERKTIPLQETDIESLVYQGMRYDKILSQSVSPEIFRDPHVAIIGGTARTALKIHAGMDIKSEIPIHDVDIIISTDANISQKAQKYNVDLTGARVVDGNVQDVLSHMVTNFDCTMNQVAIHNGKLFYSQRAFQDIQEGNIRLIGKDDPLFGSEGIEMPDGNIYLNRNGFYRGLSFLLRGKGKRLIISQENKEAEKYTIGRYWLIMLFVKILPIKNQQVRKNVIAHWHEIAYRMGSTKTQDPISFFKELISLYPEIKNYSVREGAFDIDKQIRWLIGKLTSRAVDSLFPHSNTSFPSIYTPDNLELSPRVNDYDLDSFMYAIEQAYSNNGA